MMIALPRSAPPRSTTACEVVRVNSSMFCRVPGPADTDATVALYRRLYPQFQKAYEDLGNPDGYFNDRVIEVIDHLLSAPPGPATIALAQPSVYYVFADPALEAESAGRKLLLRMGPGNAARVQAKLKEIRDRIASS